MIDNMMKENIFDKNWQLSFQQSKIDKLLTEETGLFLMLCSIFKEKLVFLNFRARQFYKSWYFDDKKKMKHEVAL